MAYPQRVSLSKSAFSSTTSSPSISLPSTINTDDLLLMFVGVDNANSITISTPSGWTEIQTGYYTTRIRYSVFVKKAIGDEDGNNITLSLSGDSRSGVAIVHDISGWGGTIADDVDIGSPNLGYSDAPDPPSVTAGWGSDDNLFIVTACGWPDDATFSSAPSNYGELQQQASGAGTGLGLEIATATREYASDTDDSGSFTLSELERWSSTAVVIKPGTSGGGGSPTASIPSIMHHFAMLRK